MEGLAAASGIIAVVGLAGQVLQGCAYLNEVFTNANTAPREIRLIAHELSNIETIVRDTPDSDLHQDELDYCNEKLSKLRKVVCKYGDLDSAGRYRRWGKRLSMAMSAEKIHKHMVGLREARRHLEHMHNVSSHDATLAKSEEVLESVRHLTTSQYEATQITSRTEGQVKEIHGITRETQRALRDLAERFVHRDTIAASWSESNVERLINAVEKVVERRLGDHKLHPKYSKTQEACPDISRADDRVRRLLQATNEVSTMLVKRQEDHTYAGLGPRVIEVTDDPYSNHEVSQWNQKDCPPLPSCVDKRSKYQTPMGKIFIRTHTVKYCSLREMQAGFSDLRGDFEEYFVHPAHFPVTITTTDVVLVPQDWHHARGAVVTSQDVSSRFSQSCDVYQEMKDFNRPPTPPFAMGQHEKQPTTGAGGHTFTEQVVEKMAFEVAQHLQHRGFDRERRPCFQEASFNWKYDSRVRSRKPFRRRRESLSAAC